MSTHVRSSIAQSTSTFQMGQNPLSPEVALTILKAIDQSDKCIIHTLDLSVSFYLVVHFQLGKLIIHTLHLLVRLYLVVL